jgi:Rrf2 family protein
MRISAKAEYACVAMFELALTDETPQPSRIKTIAQHHGISPRFLVQILLQLKAAGLVTSTRGASGGYQLARSPERISLADIINAMESTVPSRAAARAISMSAAQQALHTVWHDIEELQQKFLRELTLAEFVRRTQENGVLSYQI